MRRFMALVMVVLMMGTSLMFGFAEETFAEFKDKSYYDFYGKRGEKTEFFLSIYLEKGDAKGVYLRGQSSDEIAVKGVVRAGKWSVKEYDAKGKLTGVFEGTYKGTDEVAGMWKNVTTGSLIPFKLKLASVTPFVEYGHRYRVIGVENDKDVERYVSELQKEIKKGNSLAIADRIVYPIIVVIDGERIEIKSKKDFMDHYKGIMNPRFTKLMSAAYTKSMFASDEGVMFGYNGNNIWIKMVKGQKGKMELKIIWINND